MLMQVDYAYSLAMSYNLRMPNPESMTFHLPISMVYMLYYNITVLHDAVFYYHLQDAISGATYT